MTLWNDIIIVICLLLPGWLVWKESRRADRSRLMARIVASVVAVISLACLALPLSYWKQQREVSSGKEAVLLTEGYDPDSLRQFLQTAQAGGGGSIPGDIKVFSAANGISLLDVTADGTMPPAKSDWVNGSVLHSLSKLHVFGYGLTGKEWATLHPPPLVLHPSPPPTGILSASWKQRLISGEKLRIQGSLSLPPDRPAKLLLTGMGMSLDSVIIGPGTWGKGVSRSDSSRGKKASGLDSSRRSPVFGSDSSRTVASPGRIDFDLNTIPAQSGRSVYRLWVLSGGDAGTAASPGGHTRTDTLEQEVLAIEVLPAKKLKILLLAASPDFENTFLVNWLARNGHAVATRTLISKDKSDKAFLNMPEVALEPLTAAVLDKFDLVIADAEALQSGKPAEGAALRRQIAEKGLGLIIKADSLGAGSGVSNNPTGSRNAPAGANKAANPAGTAFYKDLFQVGAVRDSTQRLYIKERSGTLPLVRDGSSRILVSRGLYGSGKLVFTTGNETYARLLAGARKEYMAHWSLVLENAVRDAEPGEDWQFTPHLPRVNEPVEAQLQTNQSGLPQGQFGTAGNRTDSGNAALSPVPVYLSQSPLLPFQWEGTWWPSEAGWQSAATLHGETFWWYAWSAEDWRSIHRIQREAETKEYMADRLGISPDSGRMTPIAADHVPISQGADSERVPISPAWFYGLFIISCLFLWVERKI